MMHSVRSRYLAGVIAIFFCGSVSGFAWLGYRLIGEWRHSATTLAQRRADEAADLLSLALTRDMRAVQKSVLQPLAWNTFMIDPPYDVSDIVAGVFARYPYPESFFACRGGFDAEDFFFFDRADRPAAWVEQRTTLPKMPVVVHQSPEIARTIAERITSPAAAHDKFVAFELPIDGAQYQVVVRLFYEDQFNDRLVGAFGFMVNLAWASDHYFPEVARQVAKVSDFGSGLDMDIGDDTSIAAGADPDIPAGRRALPIVFFDPISTFVEQSKGWEAKDLHFSVSGARDPALLALQTTASRGALVGGVAAVILGVGVILTIGAIKAQTDLAAMRSDFVSTVTHELKTPIATIQAAGASLSAARVESIVDPGEYGKMVVQEAKRLSRLVDNLLALSRITEVGQAYSFEAVRVDEVVHTALRDHHWLLETKRFEVEADIDEGLPAIKADRLAIGLLLDNLIDNAVRYSPQQRHLTIEAVSVGSAVRIDVTDRGEGIPAHEIKQVTRKFFRGARAAAGGSGLGLAIVQQIVASHAGTLAIASEVDVGTTVSVHLPVALHP